jgi:anti-sigma regulatory factor (Ser/Thr protein kinase)
MPDDLAATAVLLLSEAATNALRYTDSGRGGKFTVRARLRHGALTVACEDDGGAATVPMVRPLTPDEVRGRGLALIDAFAETWGLLVAERNGVFYTLTWKAPPLARVLPLPSPPER